MSKSIFETEAGCSDTDDESLDWNAVGTYSDDEFIVGEDLVEEDYLTDSSESDMSLHERPAVVGAFPQKRQRIIQSDSDDESDTEIQTDEAVGILTGLVRSDVATVPNIDADPFNVVPLPEYVETDGYRCRRFHMVLNNWTAAEYDAFVNKFGDITKYRLCGKEIGEGGTPHLQCYVEVATVMTIAGLQKKITACQGFPTRYSVFCCKGNAEQNIRYCSKDNDVFSAGVVPRGQGKRSDLEDVAEAITNGSSIREIALQHPGAYIKYSKGITNLHNQVNDVPRTDMTLGYWAFGATGVGKSRWAHGISPSSTYVKDGSTQWWDGYDREETVIVDDYRANGRFAFNTLLKVCDRYPHPIEVKGGTMQFNSKRVVITTPLSIDATFAHLDWMAEGQIAQLKRRFIELEFGPGKLSHLLTIEEANNMF